MARITERREVRVEGDHGTFVFAAEPDAGRLVVREERGDGDEEMCALTISDRDELSVFLQGLRRVLGVAEGESSAPIDHRDQPEPSGQASGQASGFGRASLSGQRTGSGPSRSSGPPASSGPASSPPDETGQARQQAEPGQDRERDEESRREAMERARARGQRQAFAPWTRDEEQRLLEGVEAGRGLDELAREHGRSSRALQLRLERLRG